MCLAGAVVASWSLRQDAAGSNPFTVMTNIFVTEFSEFNKKTNIFPYFKFRFQLKLKYHFVSLNVSWSTDHQNALQLTTVNSSANGQKVMT